MNSNVKIRNHQYGLNLDPNSYKANILNEQISFKFNNLKLKLIAGICSPKIDFENNAEVKQGDPIAVFIDGIAIITIKEDSNLVIKLGDKLKAGQTVIL